MCFDSVAIRVDAVTKAYTVYDRPQDRLWHALVRRFEGIAPEAGRRIARQFLALDGVSLRVMRGQTVGILGRNGAGKSTLLQVIAGTLRPTTGSVEVVGRVVALLELGSGFNHEFTGIENVYLNAAVLGLTRAETAARLERILAFADIGEHIHQPVKTYSSGMTMRLAFAVAAHLEPAVLIVDEALSVGDIRFQNKCLRRLEEFRRSGCSILLVSHNPNLMEAVCDHVVWLDEGKVRAQGSPATVVRDYVNFMTHGIDGEGSTGRVPGHETVIGSPSAADAAAWQWIDVAPGRNERTTGAARFTRVRVACGGAVNATQLDSRETRFEVQAQVVVFRDVSSPLFGVGVFNELNEPVVHFNSHNLSCSLQPLRAGSNAMLLAKVTLPALRPGQYLVALGIDDGVPGASELLCHLYDAWQLRVANPTDRRVQGGQVQATDAQLDVQAGVS